MSSNIRLTKFELEIMEQLWRLERASVREIQEVLPEKRRPAYTTIQTMVHRLEEKGAVRQVRKIGNAFVYEPAITRDSAYRRLIREFLSVWGGSARPVMAHLVEEGRLGLKEIKELEEMVREQGEAAAAEVNKATGRKKK